MSKKVQISCTHESCLRTYFKLTFVDRGGGGRNQIRAVCAHCRRTITFAVGQV